MREGLNFNPRVTEFTDICTRIRLAVPHSFSNTTLSLLSIPKTYSPCYICHRMRPFTVLRAEWKNKKQNNKNVKANWIPSVEIERCLRDNLQPRYGLEIPLLYCILTEGLTSGKEKKWHVTSDSFELSTCHLQHIQTSCQALVFPLRWRWPRS